jgi:hypothetical protein
MRNALIFYVFLIILCCTAGAADTPFTIAWEHQLIKGADDLQVLDFDKDNILEIYVSSYSSKGSMLSCFNANGTLLWDAEIPKFSYSTYPTEEIKLVRVGDVDRDENLDLVIGGEAIAPTVSYHPLYLAERMQERGGESATIQRRWTYDKSGLTTSAEIADLYGNKVKYIVVSSSDFNVYIYSAQGGLVGKYPVGSSVWDVHALNADNDSKLELVAAAFQGIFFFDLDNASSWVYNTENKVLRVSSFDLNSDGMSELIGSSRFDFYVLNANGRLLWEQKIEDLTSNIVVADLEGDGIFEILFASEGKLNVLNSTGTLLWEETLPGRINSVGVLDANRDGVLEVVAGSNNRVSLLKLELSYVKKNLAVKHHESALKYYSEGNISEAIRELNESIRLYFELDDAKTAEELKILLEEYERSLLFEDKINLALRYLNKSRQLYDAKLWDNSSFYSEEARKIFEELNHSYGIQEATGLIEKVEDHKKADALLDNAEKQYVSGRFEEAATDARSAYNLYAKLNDSFGAKKSNSVLSLSEQELKTTTLFETTTIDLTGVEATTFVVSTTVAPKKKETVSETQDFRNRYALYAMGVVALIFVYYTAKKAKDFKKAK